MKLTFVLRNRKNALKVSTKTIESFIERIKTDTKDGAVTRRRKQLSYGDYIEGYDRQYPSHLIYPSAEFEKDANDNLRMKTFNGVIALAVLEWNRRFSVKSSADLLFLDYFEPAIDEQDGTWMSASAIFSYLKEKVGVSLLKPTGISAFGRKLTNLPGLRKRETKYSTEYLVRQKKR